MTPFEFGRGMERAIPPGSALLSTAYPEIEVGDSYRIQERVVASFLAEGRSIKGYKIGLTSKAMQEMVGSTEPDFSAMLDHMFIDESAEVARADWADPIVKIELAFVMKDKLQVPGGLDMLQSATRPDGL